MENNGFHINGKLVTSETLATIMVNDFSKLGENIFRQLSEIAKNEIQEDSESEFKWLMNKDIIKNECLGFSASLLLLLIYAINEAPVDIKHEMNKKMMNIYYQSDEELETVLQISKISVTCIKMIATEWKFEKIIPGGFNNEANASRMIANNILQKLSEHALKIGSKIPKWNTHHLYLIEQVFQAEVNSAFVKLEANPLTYDTNH